jgi:hypothetical protein
MLLCSDPGRRGNLRLHRRIPMGVQARPAEVPAW